MGCAGPEKGGGPGQTEVPSYGDDSHRANRALPAWPQHTQGPKYPWGDGVGGREGQRDVQEGVAAT